MTTGRINQIAAFTFLHARSAPLNQRPRCAVRPFNRQEPTSQLAARIPIRPGPGTRNQQAT